MICCWMSFWYYEITNSKTWAVSVASKASIIFSLTYFTFMPILINQTYISFNFCNFKNSNVIVLISTTLHLLIMCVLIFYFMTSNQDIFLLLHYFDLKNTMTIYLLCNSTNSLSVYLEKHPSMLYSWWHSYRITFIYAREVSRY